MLVRVALFGCIIRVLFMKYKGVLTVEKNISSLNVSAGAGFPNAGPHQEASKPSGHGIMPLGALLDRVISNKVIVHNYADRVNHLPQTAVSQPKLAAAGILAHTNLVGSYS